jgi:hypothetical protein
VPVDLLFGKTYGHAHRFLLGIFFGSSDDADGCAMMANCLADKRVGGARTAAHHGPAREHAAVRASFALTVAREVQVNVSDGFGGAKPAFDDLR